MQIRRASGLFVAALLLKSLLIFSRHLSTDSQVFLGWSWSYATTLGILVLIGAWEILSEVVNPNRRFRFFDSFAGRWTASLTLVGIGFFWVSPASRFLLGDFPFHAAVLLPTLCILILLQVWFIHSGNIWIAVSGNSLALPLLLLLCLELPIVSEQRRSYIYGHWGDRFTFAFGEEKVEPLIGPGGRFAPGRRLLLASLGESISTGVDFNTNSLGFRNSEELGLSKDAAEYRILHIGDSFFGGFGIAQQKFVGAVLEQRLNQKLATLVGKRVRVLNAEVGDAVIGLWYLQKYGASLRPDLIVFGLFPGNDYFTNYVATCIQQSHLLLDSKSRLQFNPEFSQKTLTQVSFGLLSGYPYAKGRKLSANNPELSLWLGQHASGVPFFSIAHFRLPAMIIGNLFRERTPYPGDSLPSYVSHLESNGSKQLFDPSTSPWLFYKGPIPEHELILSCTYALILAQQQFARESGIPYVLFNVPLRLQTQTLDWELFRKEWGILEDDFDLLQPNNRLREFADQHGVVLVDPIADFRLQSEKENLYLPGDLHWNERGHELAANAIEERILPLIKEQLGSRN